MLKTRFLHAQMILLMLLFFAAGAFGQQKIITGTIKDDKGNPVAKATVSAKGTKNVLSTSVGTFSITVPTTTTILIV